MMIMMHKENVIINRYESGLSGSVDDKLLQMLLYSAMTDLIYESTSDDWEVYE
jgi:hypothetical protein